MTKSTLTNQQHDPNKYRYTPDLYGWQDAVWDYFMEHCDITPGGVFFIKFHSDSKKEFMNHVRSRWKHNYHRDDPKKRYEEGQLLQEKHKQNKLEAKAQWQERKKRQEVEWRRRLRSYIIKLVNKHI